MDKDLAKTISFLDTRIDDALAAIQCFIEEHGDNRYIHVARSRLVACVKHVKEQHPSLRHHIRNADL